MSNESATELFKALDKIGASSLTDEDCCQLLACLYYDHGSNEEFVFNWKLNTDVRIAQQRLNICSGGEPNTALFVKFKQFCKELEQSDKPEWYKLLLAKYNLD